jgi:hypothetical protein
VAEPVKGGGLNAVFTSRGELDAPGLDADD